MQLFRGRVLAVTGVAVLLWAVIAQGGAGEVRYAAAGAAAAALGLLTVRFFRTGRVSAYRLLSVAAGLTVFLCFLLRTAFFYFGYYRDVMCCVGEGRSVLCTVTERQNFTGYSSQYQVRVEEIDGAECVTKAILYCDYASDYPVGSILELRGAAVGDAGEEYPGNISDGILLTLDAALSGDTEVTGEKEGAVRRAEFRNWNRRLSSRLKQAVGGEEGKLCARMLLGGSDMSPDLRRDFRRAGISHLLAVSGMHLSLLCAALDTILLRLRVGKRGRILLLSVLVLFYLCLLDFPASAVRAGGMLLLSYGLFFLGGDSDGLTSLFSALTAILFVSPTAILDSGFLLSASATFGILSLGPACAGCAERYALFLKNRPERVGKRHPVRDFWEKLLLWFLRKGLPPLSVIFSANMMTSVPTAFLFGKTSLMSPISNLIAPLPAEAALLLSALTLLFPEGSFLQGMSAYYAGKCAEFLLRLAGKISDVRGAELSLRSPAVRWILIAATAATLFLLCIRLRRRAWVIAPFLAAVVCIAGYLSFLVPDTVHVFFSESGTEDSVTAVSHGAAVVADFTSGSGRALSEAAALAEEAGATEIEALLLSHYHARHVGSVEKLLLQQKVRRLWMPEPRTGNDASVFLRLCEIADTLGTECRIYGEDDAFVIFDYVTLSSSGPVPIARSTHPVLSLQLSDGTQSVRYWGKSAEESALMSRFPPAEPGTAVVLGNHGPVQKKASAEELVLCGSIHLFSEEKLPFLVGGRDPVPWFGKLILHEKTAYFQFHR